MRRVMCVYLPQWPLQRLRHDYPELRDKAVVLVNSHTSRGAQVLLGSPLAARCGIRPSMPLAEALAVDPHLTVREEEPEKDRQALEQLAVWAERYSPIVGLEEGSRPQSLLLDIFGCAACFHGEENLLERAVREWQEQGWTARIAIADTVGAAWALAHFAKNPGFSEKPGFWTPPGEMENDLRPLPVIALRLPDDTPNLLITLGIERIEQLLALPRSSMPARFGDIVLQRLDQALGHLPEMIVPHRFLPEIREIYPFEYATDRRAVLNCTLDRLADRIHETLKKRSWGARQIECRLYHATVPPRRIEVRLVNASHAPEHIGMLLRTALEQTQIAEPVFAMCLHVPIAEPLLESQPDLFEGERRHEPRELSALFDRLSNRFGREAVSRATLVPDPQPEYAWRLEPIDFKIQNPQSKIQNPQRPLQLWPRPVNVQVMSIVPEGPPIRFRWKGTDYHIARSWGPERIETGWWRGVDIRRDYYVVATHRGNRFWLFRRRDDGRWFLHGCFD